MWCGCPWTRTVETSPGLKRRVLDPQSSGEFTPFVPLKRSRKGKMCVPNESGEFSSMIFPLTMDMCGNCIFFRVSLVICIQTSVLVTIDMPVPIIRASSREIFSHKSVATSYLTNGYIYIYMLHAWISQHSELITTPCLPGEVSSRNVSHKSG